MRKYIITYDTTGYVFRDGQLCPATGCKYELSAQNQKEARKKFREIWITLWHERTPLYIRKIERKVTK